MKKFAIAIGVTVTITVLALHSAAVARANQIIPVITDTKTLSTPPAGGSNIKKGGTLLVVASIDNPGSNEYKIVKFTLRKNRVLHLFARGRVNISGTNDTGGIENAETGQLIWVMHYLSTRHAGGSQENRSVDRLLPLRAGTYRLHFKSGPPSSPKNWIPPVQHIMDRGIWLIDETEQHNKLLSNFWEKAASPEEFGWSGTKLDELIPLMKKFGTDALMIVTDGKIIYEYGNTTNMIRSHSTRKSLLSALYGIYVAEGKIETGKTLAQLGITDSVPLTPEEKQATISDLLKARSGVYIPAAAEVESMRKARPPRGSHKPGTFWYYNNWDFNVLGTIFRQETGFDLYRAFKQRIAEPIGMQDFIIQKQTYAFERQYSLHPAYPFLISTRDMAKVGQLFLQQGMWHGKQILPAGWIEASTTPYSNTKTPGVGYGYMWWILTQEAYGMPKGSYYASGYAGQKLFVLPAINSLIVHRTNIDIPGTIISTAQFSPYVIVKNILSAFTGKRAEQEQLSGIKTGKLVAEKSLLIEYGRTAQYYGKALPGLRIAFWICAVTLAGGFFIWIAIYLIRLGTGSKLAPKSNSGRHRRFAWLLKWTSATGSFICSIYIYVILTTPHAFEFVIMVGMPRGLELHQLVLLHIPKLGALLAIFFLIANIPVWIKQYWTLPERIHFGVITLVTTIFAAVAHHLNLIILT